MVDAVERGKNDVRVPPDSTAEPMDVNGLDEETASLDVWFGHQLKKN